MNDLIKEPVAAPVVQHESRTGVATHGDADAGLIKTDFQRRVYCILGLPFDAVNLAQAEHKLLADVSRGKRNFFSTPNLNFLIACLTDSAFRDSVIRSDLSLADGMPVIWMARALGLPITERVAGSTVFEQLRAQRSVPVKVYFFGGPTGVASRAGEVINADRGAMTCVGSHSPGFGSIAEMSPAHLIDEINASKADFLVVALGAKKGQAWIEYNLDRLTVPLISHLGAVVNFVAGTVVRAPSAWGRFGLEWLWRIKEEPSLWRRYRDDGLALIRLLSTRVLPGAMAAARLKKQLLKNGVGTLAVERSDAMARQEKILLGGFWHDGNLQSLRDALTECTGTPTGMAVDLQIDMAAVEGVDSAVIGLLMLAFGHQSRTGGKFVITPVSLQVRTALKLQCAEYLLQAGNVR